MSAQTVVVAEGKSFHTRAPATGKARCPTIVESLTAGTDRLLVVEDRSLCRGQPAMPSPALTIFIMRGTFSNLYTRFSTALVGLLVKL